MRSRRPWAATRRRPARAATGSSGGEPRGERDDAAHRRVVGDVDRGPAAHRVAEQHDGDLAELRAHRVQRPAGVLDRSGAAVPAAVPVAQQPDARRPPRWAPRASARAWPRTGARTALRPSTTSCAAVLAAVQHQRPRPRASPGRRTGSAVRVSAHVDGCVHADVFGCGRSCPEVAGPVAMRARQDRAMSDDPEAAPAEARERAPGAERADRGGPLALLRARRPDPLRRRLRRPAARARGARGAVPRAAHARLADPEGRRRGLDRVHRGRPPAPDGEPRQRVHLRASSSPGTPGWRATASTTPTCCASSRSTGWRSTCSTRGAGWCGR